MKKNKIVIIAISFFILMTFCIYNIYVEKTTVFGVNVIDEDQVKNIVKNKELDQDIKLYYNGEIIPNIDKQNRYLLSQNNNYKYNGNLSVDTNYNIKVIKTKNNKAELMKGNIPLKAVIYSDEDYKLVDIIMTNIPVVSLSDNEYEYHYFKDGTEYQIAFADMVLFDSIGNGGDAINIEKSKCKYHIRGKSSKAYPKQSFKLNLLDKDNEPKKKKLLNMRDDNDWILNAMYVDHSRMKENISFKLWDFINQDNNKNTEYVELIINGTYRGVYMLETPVDHKTFNSKKNKDILFSVNDRNKELNERYLFNNDVDFENETVVDEFEIDKPDYIDNKIGFELVRKMYSDIFELEYYSPFSIEYNVDNFAKYALLINMIEATDNSYKNQKIMFKQKTKYNYIFEKEAWDLDSSMLENNFGEVDINKIIIDELLPISIKNNSNYLKIQRKYYINARKTYYNVENLYDMIDKIDSYLKEGSAIYRDMKKWEYDDYEKDLDKIRNFYDKRIMVLDKYYIGE